MSENPSNKHKAQIAGENLALPQVYRRDADTHLNKLKTLSQFVKTAGWDETQVPKDMNSLVTSGRFTNLQRATEAEDDLILKLRLCKWFRAILKIDQTPYCLSEELIPPDLLVVAPTERPDYIPASAFVEVKATEGWTWQISKKDLTRRTNFASACNLPLFFAVRLGPDPGAWCLLPSDELAKKGRKVGLPEVVNSWWDEFAVDFRMLVPKSVRLTEVWDNLDGTFNPVCRHPEMGGLRHFEITRGGRNLTGKFANTAPMHALFSFFPANVQREKSPSGGWIVQRSLEISCLRLTDFLTYAISQIEGWPANSSQILQQLSKAENELAASWHVMSACTASAAQQGFLVALKSRHGTDELYQISPTVRLTEAHLR